MATYADLKTRIVTETHREDLDTGGDFASHLNTLVADAVATYADEEFWFNRVRATATTSASTATVALPAGLLLPTRVQYGGTALEKIALEEIPDDQTEDEPRFWAAYNDSVWLDPVPGGVYTLTFLGIADVAAPTADGDDNIWTNEAARLIAAHARFLFYRDVSQDDEAASALAAARDALADLKRRSRRFNRAPMRVEPGLAAIGHRNKGYLA